MQAPRVLIVDDNVVVRTGLSSLVEASGAEVIGEAGDGRTAIELAERLAPDLVLLDVQMPLLDGVAAARVLSTTSRVIMLTYTDDPAIVRSAIENGAVGYLVHGTFSPDELAAAVHGVVGGSNPLSPTAVSALVGAVRGTSQAVPAPDRSAPDRYVPVERETGDFGLSAREADVMRLISRGRSNSEIAGQLFLAEKTVKNHVNRIYAKLGVTSRAAAIARWIGLSEETDR